MPEHLLPAASLPVKGTKARLLAALKVRGQASIAELARDLGVTRTAVHGHLRDLLRQDLVRLRSVARQGRGRPGHLYELSSAGEDSFPKDYLGLCCEIFGQIRDVCGRQGLYRLLVRRNYQLARRWRAELRRDPPQSRLAGLVARLSQAGFAAQGSEDGTWLRLGHCPYSAVARRFPELCAAELRLHEAVLGVKVYRDGPRIVDGNRACCYRLARPTGEAS